MLGIQELELSTASGMRVVLLNLGAAISKIFVPDREGHFANVTLPIRGADDSSYAGVTLAPYGGRIPDGEMTIDGMRYALVCNEGTNQLHGGPDAPARKIWTVEEKSCGEGYQQITFRAQAADGLDGFPGNRVFRARYRLYEDQRLEITLTAQSDKATRVNLSNHAYFNLSGDFSRKIHDHALSIAADRYYVNGENNRLVALEEAAGQMDRRELRVMGEPAGDPQIVSGRGFNHFFVLEKERTVPAAQLLHPESGRRMRLYTDQPCVVAYSGGWLEEPHCAIALEAEEHPLYPFAEPTKPLYPGEIYERHIVYAFDMV